jgi:hypothetical protein
MDIGKEVKKIETGEYNIAFLVESDTISFNPKTLLIYEMAKKFSDDGKNTVVLHENDKYKIPSWAKEKAEGIKHMSLADANKSLFFGAADSIILPDTFLEVAAQLSEEKIPAFVSLLVTDLDAFLSVYDLGNHIRGYYGVDSFIAPDRVIAGELRHYFRDVPIYVISPDYSSYKMPEQKRKPVVLLSDHTETSLDSFVKRFYARFSDTFAFVPFKVLDRSSPMQMADQMSKSACLVHLEPHNVFQHEKILAALNGCKSIGIFSDTLDERINDDPSFSVSFSAGDLMERVAAHISDFLMDAASRAPSEYAASFDEGNMSAGASSFLAETEKIKKEALVKIKQKNEQ